MPKPTERRILVVDDHPVLRDGLRALFGSTNDLVVCGEAENGAEAMAAVQKLRPDLAIVDVSLRGGEDGIELTRRLRKKWPALPILVFSLHQRQVYRDDALAAGASGYCIKGKGSKPLIQAIRKVLRSVARRPSRSSPQ